jgi:hypothetical protein
MSQDKQLLSVQLEKVLEKRRLDQALNAKEFAVAAGISYSTAREWFRAPDFPVIRGVVFWKDFVDWRTAQYGLRSIEYGQLRNATTVQPVHSDVTQLPGRAAQILAGA